MQGPSISMQERCTGLGGELAIEFDSQDEDECEELFAGGKAISITYATPKYRLLIERRILGVKHWDLLSVFTVFVIQKRVLQPV